jgi:hypothetical protein
LELISAKNGGAIMLSGLSRRERAIAMRLEANTNYLRIVVDCACITKPGHDALQKHRAAFGDSKTCPSSSRTSVSSPTISQVGDGSS